MKTLYFATHNPHKVKEIQALLVSEFEIKTLTELGCEEDIPETGSTFFENAQQKTDYIVRKYKVSCFADDSGLEVDALNGEPGVHSARYSGSRDMEENMRFLLRKMEGQKNRKARFKTVVSLFWKGEQHFFEGSIEGELISEKKGEGGFGYDPIFIPEGYNLTFAEMPAEEKNRISHRAIAVKKLAAFLLKNKE